MPEPLDDRHPAGLRSLPGALVLAAGIRPVDQLIPIHRCSADIDRERGARDRLEADRDLAKVKIDVCDNLSGLLGDCVKRKGVVVAGEQVGGQHLIIGLVVRLVEDAVVESGAVGACGQYGGRCSVGGDAVMPEETFQSDIAGIGDGKIIAHGVPSQHRGVAPLGNGHAQIGGLVIGRELDDLPGVFQRDIVNSGVHLPIGRRRDLLDLVAR